MVGWEWEGGLMESQVLLESLGLLVGLEMEIQEPEEGAGQSSGPVEFPQDVLAVVQVLLTPQVVFAVQGQRMEAVLYPVLH